MRRHVKGFRTERIMPTRKWYLNGCLVANEEPANGWGDGSIQEMRDMLMSVCMERVVPDCDFFMNKRDFPVLRRDGRDPAYHK